LEAKVSEHKPSRWLYALTAGVLLVGTMLVVVGTRNPGDGVNADRQSRIAETCPPLSVTAGVLDRAAALERMQCAGCHSDDRREIGPSYEVIAARYHCRADRLLAAINHPEPGWADYPPGPAGPPLARDDRSALVAWILNQEGK
jgi:cytochrome c551/c552